MPTRRALSTSKTQLTYHLTSSTTPPNSTALTMVTIDHTAYPTLIDAIISQASPQALFKLRLTSRDFRTRIDTLFGTHVKLRVVDKDTVAAVLPHRYRFPGPGPTSWVMFIPPGAIRVLDIGPDALALSKTDLADIFAKCLAVKIVRRFRFNGTKYRTLGVLPKSTRTVVDFIHFSVGSPMPSIYLCARQQIIHLRIGDEETQHRHSVRAEGRVPSVVLVVWPGAKIKLTYYPVTLIALEPLMQSILKLRPRRFTIVGMEQIYPLVEAAFSFIGSTATHDWEASTQGPLRSTRDWLNKTDLRFLTVEEWWAELLPGEKDIIGVWPSRVSSAGSKSPVDVPVPAQSPGPSTPANESIGTSPAAAPVHVMGWLDTLCKFLW